jgi:3-phenylpropionate/trans-cinnamate dioxygenase ferredoxin reductase component
VRSDRDGAGVVIVGGGPAGWSCAFALRERGHAGPITCVCAEPRHPYDRTMVSKDCLRWRPEEHELSLSPRDAYDDAALTMRLGVRATAIDPSSHRVRLDDGEELPYDALVLATGGRPLVPPSLAGPGIHVLRELADAERLAEDLAGAERLAIVGGGFIAGEVATAAVARGLEVVMLEALDAPLARVVGPEVGERVAELHRRAGVDVRVRALARTITPSRDGFVVELLDGAAVSAGVVVVATGMEPAVGWLQGTPGISLDGGVVTDEFCATGAPDVYAAGDCARWLNRRTGALSRVEHWDTAVRHGQAVAASITGAAEPFVPVPFVWSMQYGARLQWVGEAEGWDQVVVENAGAPEGLVARYLRDGELCAGFAIDAPRAIAAMRRELTRAYRTEVVTAE